MTAIAPHISAFLRQRLPLERGCSTHTCDTYAYAFQLLFQFASQELGVSPSQMHLEQLDAALILRFLENLQTQRQSGPRTRNARLVAIRSFMRFLEHRVPSALDQIHRVLAIPMAKAEGRLVRHLDVNEYQALLDSPNATIRLGIRDRGMLHLALTAGLRVSELVGLREEDVTFDGGYADIRIFGKGRKERNLRLWKAVAESLRAWLAVRGRAATPELFLNAWGKPMTRFGFQKMLSKHTAAAARRCNSLQGKKVSPHMLRHTAAVNMYRATKDLRKVALWLGHTTTRTAEEFYLPIDPEEKLEALASMTPPVLRPGKFHPPDRLLAMLKGQDYEDLHA